MKRIAGHGLVELLLVLGVIAASAGIIYAFYREVSDNQAQAQALQEARQTVARVQDSFRSQASYAGLTQDQALDEGLFGPQAQVVDGRVLVDPVGEVMLAVLDAPVRGQVVVGSGFELIFQSAPEELCPTLAMASDQAAWASIGERRVLLDSAVDPAAIAGACAQQARDGRVRVALAFVNAQANEALDACVPPGGPQERIAQCPAGQTGEQRQQRTGQCVDPYGQVQWSAWTTLSDTCQPCPGSETGTQACPPGQYGQQATERSFDCQAGHWGPWTVLTSTCQPCPEPETRTGQCLTGQTGYTVEKRQFDCSAGEWGPWVVRERHCSSPVEP